MRLQGSKRGSDFSSPALLGDSVAFEVPGLVHHEFEVVIAVDAHGHVVVVLEPLVHADFAIPLVLHLIGVVQLKGVQEFVQDLIFSLFARLYIWVLLGIVALADIVDGNGSTVVKVHDLKGTHSKTFAELVHLSPHASKELFVVNRTV